MTESVDTVVVGGGQAGLAMSYHLTQRRLEHVVLERGRIGERWRSERWDSLMFQFPNWMMRLPGQPYTGSDPDGFTHRDGVVRFIDEYADRIWPPIRCGVCVRRVQRAARDGRFLVATDEGDYEARHVIAATGPYQLPVVPSFASSLGPSILQVTASRYTNAGDLPRGAVLVVGSGASGCQIAEDLLRSGRDVSLCVGRHRRVPRRYRGHDFGWWLERIGLLDRTREQLPEDFIPALITGVGGGHDVDLRRMANAGVRLAGSVVSMEDGRAHFRADLNEHLAHGDEGIEDFTSAVDEYVRSNHLDVPVEKCLHDSFRLDEPESMSLAKFASVIWCTGYRSDFGWLRFPVCDERGEALHRRGVTSVDGLYFLGLPRMHKVKSSFMWGVGEDAEYLAEHIAARR